MKTSASSEKKSCACFPGIRKLMCSTVCVACLEKRYHVPRIIRFLRAPKNVCQPQVAFTEFCDISDCNLLSCFRIDVFVISPLNRCTHWNSRAVFPDEPVAVIHV